MTTVTLNDYTSAKMDALMATGRFASREEMVLQGLSLLEELAEEEYSPEMLAAIDEGLADIEAGRTIPIEVVFDRLIKRLEAKTSIAAERSSSSTREPTAASTN